MHSRLIFLHHVVFPKGGRFLEIPVSYGYDTGGMGLIDREIRRSQDSVPSRAGQPVRGKERGPRKASRVKHYVPVPKPTQVDGCKSTKVYERNIVQELGKKAAVTSG